MSKILLVDTNFSSIPIYNALVRKGHDVHVIGANPDDALAKVSKKYTCLDYSNTSELKLFINDESFKYIVPGCTDKSYESCSSVGGGTSLWLGDDIDAYNAINNKAIFRRVAHRLGLPVPKVYSCDAAGIVKTPLIVKPVDSFSGRGITILRSPSLEGLAFAVQHARNSSPTRECIIEDYIEGQLYSHSAYIESGKVSADFIVQEDCTNNPFAVDTSRLISRGLDQLRLALRDCTEALANDLGLVDGLFHSQFIGAGDQFWIIEATRRCPGDLYSLLIEFSSGFRYAENYAACFTGRDVNYFVHDNFRQILRHTISAPHAHHMMGLHFNYPVCLDYYVPTKLVGDSVGNEGNGRVGVAFFREDSLEKLEELYRKILNKDLLTLPS